MRGYVDTNVIVRLVTRDTPSLARNAAALVRANSPVRVHGAVMLETAYVIQHIYQRSRTTVAETLTGLLSSPHFVVDEHALWARTLDLYATTSLHILDCHLAARASIENVPLLTLDQALARLVRSLNAGS